MQLLAGREWEVCEKSLENPEEANETAEVRALSASCDLQTQPYIGFSTS